MQSTRKPQVVIDTNVWISGLVFGGKPEEILRLFVDGNIIIAMSEELLSELRRKVIRRFPLFVPQLGLLEASIKEQAILVQLGTISIPLSRDADDNKFIETAIIGKADYIVNGDKDLLVLKSYKRIRILTPAEFLECIA